MNDRSKPPTAWHCVPMPEFERLNFFYGQALSVADFRAEQAYFMEKLRLYNRCFHGHGIVCGLEVEPVPEEQDCDSELRRTRHQLETQIAKFDTQIADLEKALSKARESNGENEPGKDLQQANTGEEEIAGLSAQREQLRRELEQLPDCPPRDCHNTAEILVNCGWALDCEGQDILVHRPQRLDLWHLLSGEQRQQVEQSDDQEICLELSICYCEQPTYPTRPAYTDTCSNASKCVHGRIREGFTFKLSTELSEPDSRCDTCCDPCQHCRVVLAHIHWHPTRELLPEEIDWRPRRAVTTYQPAVITGVSWLHGATYTSEQAKIALGTTQADGTRTDGIEVMLSRPVYAETLQPGVVELWRIQGGRGLSAIITYIEGSYVDKPASGLINSFKYRDDSGENLNQGDRILITIRGNFILDACCQPLDGEHVGAQVPQLDKYLDDTIDDSTVPPAPPCASARRQPWTSGNGHPGSTFESWFFIK